MDSGGPTAPANLGILEIGGYNIKHQIWCLSPNVFCDVTVLNKCVQS